MMLMPEFVFDTNILVAGLRSKRGASYRLLRLLVDEQLRVNVSVALALEYEDVLKRPGLVTGFSDAEIDVFLDFLVSTATLLPSVPHLRPTLRDADDERILEVAVACRAIIVTHNKKDFERAAEFGITVMSPAEVLQILKGAV